MNITVAIIYKNIIYKKSNYVIETHLCKEVNEAAFNYFLLLNLT